MRDFPEVRVPGSFWPDPPGDTFQEKGGLCPWRHYEKLNPRQPDCTGTDTVPHLGGPEWSPETARSTPMPSGWVGRGSAMKPMSRQKKGGGIVLGVLLNQKGVFGKGC